MSKKEFIIKAWNFLKELYSRYTEEKIFKESAALTFITVLGFVPFISFLLFLLPDIPFLNFQSNLEKILITVFLPQSAEQISNYMSELVAKKVSFNIVSMIAMIITSYSLFKVINDAFDKILYIHKRKKEDIISSLMKFFGTIIFGFLIILLLFSATSLPFVSSLIHLKFLKAIATVILPVLLLFTILTVIFLFVPSHKLKPRSLIIGAACSTFAWTIVRSLFTFYVENLTSMKSLYGVLASFPIFLFWIYLNWIIVLGGVIIISILEKRYRPTGKLVNKSGKLRLVIEKSIDRDEYEKVELEHVDEDKLALVLKNIFHDERKDNL